MVFTGSANAAATHCYGYDEKTSRWIDNKGFPPAVLKLVHGKTIRAVIAGNREDIEQF